MIPDPVTALSAWGLVKRFWWLAPLAVLIGCVMVLRGTVADLEAELAREQTAHQHTVANYELAAEQRKASDLFNLQRVGTEQAEITERKVDEYQDRIAALRADFAERVRLAQAKADPGGAGRTDLPGLPEGAGRADATACEAEFPPRDALIASEQAEQLIALQGWVTEVAAVDVNGADPP